MNLDLTDITSSDFNIIKPSKKNTIFNIILIVIIIIVLYNIFGNNSETFTDIILEKDINMSVSPTGMMGSYSNKNLMAELSNAKNYTDSKTNDSIRFLNLSNISLIFYNSSDFKFSFYFKDSIT